MVIGVMVFFAIGVTVMSAGILTTTRHIPLYRLFRNQPAPLTSGFPTSRRQLRPHDAWVGPSDVVGLVAVVFGYLVALSGILVVVPMLSV